MCDFLPVKSRRVSFTPVQYNSFSLVIWKVKIKLNLYIIIYKLKV